MRRLLNSWSIVFTMLVFAPALSSGQYAYQAVFPALTGDALVSEVRAAFTPEIVIPYAFARDTLFLKIDAINRNLSCIYTGHTLPIPEGQDPTQAVFLNGANDGINTEHTYPQGFGLADTKAESDMHNLFPSRVKTNNDRGNRPFGESPDGSTTRWYLLNTELTSVPSSMIDKYSELGSAGQFEPREEVKGDIARAMMYTYTIYRDLVGPANPEFFPMQKDILCQWHEQDPVDEKEWNRTWKIASYQSGKANPFVLDCSLASRIYCGNVSTSCRLLDVQQTATSSGLVYQSATSTLILPEGSRTLWVYDLTGRLLYHETDGNACKELRWQAPNVPSILIARVQLENGQLALSRFFPGR